MRPHQALLGSRKNQRGVALVLELIIYLTMMSMMGFTVASGVKMLVNQTSAGANQLQQKSSVLQAMNRTAADITAAKPIVYAAPTELVTENALNVAGQSSKTVQQRYVLGIAPGAAAGSPLNTLYSQQRDVTGGQKYDPSQAGTYWGALRPEQAVVRNIKAPVAEIYQYFDRSGNKLSGVFGNIPSLSNSDVIARVDSVLTANLDKAGYVQLASSAVPRAALPVDISAQNLVPPNCPPATAARSDDGINSVVRWSAIAGSTAYEVWRDGTRITNPPIAAVAGQTDYFYQEPLVQDGTPHQYVVLAVSAAGVSSGCNPINVTSEIPATMLIGQMIPATNGANAWTSTAWSNPTQTTTMRLTWNSVVGASGYILYRAPVDNLGQAGQKVETARFDPTDTLSFDYPAEWDKKWQWTVTVTATSGGSKDSNAVALRGYPSPITPDLTATDFSKNTVDWTSYTPDANVDSYAIYRFDDGVTTGTPKLLATYVRGDANFATEKYLDDGTKHAFGKPALGSTHNYVVVAHNESGFSNKPLVPQLQFPPDPGLTPVGAAGSRDNDNGTARSNTLKWSAAKSATGYQVYRSLNNNGVVTNYCITSADCTKSAGATAALFRTDSDASFVKASTVYQYTAVAFNATGASPGLAGTVPLVQRPDVQVISAPSGADIPDLNDTWTTIRFARNAGGWCQIGTVIPGSDKCSYEATNYDNGRNAKAAVPVDASASAVSFGNQDWGRHFYYKVRSRNGAVTNDGYSEYSNEVSADTYPGKFTVNGGIGSAARASSGDKQNTDLYWDYIYSSVDSGTLYFPGCNGDTTKDGCGPHWGYIVATWGASTGAKSIVATKRNITDSNKTYGNGSYGGSDGSTEAIALPGNQYNFTMTATSLENSLQRPVTTATINTNPDINYASQIALTCIGSGNSEYFKIAQTVFNQSPVRGYWSSGTTYSVYNTVKDGPFYGGSVNNTYTPGQGYAQVNATNWGLKGNPYITSGFYSYVTWDNVGYSYRNDNLLTQVTPPGRCGAVTGPAADQGNYIEPSDACYGYYPGIKGCVPTIPGNRPQQYSR